MRTDLIKDILKPCLLDNRYYEGWLEVLLWFLEHKPSREDLLNVNDICSSKVVGVNRFGQGCSDALDWLLTTQY